MNFYRRYLGAYAKKTAHLSLTEHGAYQVLLDTYYSTGKSLPASTAELHRICRAMTPPERKAVDKVADEFFPVNGDGTRHNERADEELTAYATQAETNRCIAVEREAKRKQHEDSTKRATNREPNSEVRSTPRSKDPADAADVTVWELGVSFIVSRGISEKQARSLLGAHYKTDKEKLAGIVGAMLQVKPIDPVAYLQKSMQPEKKKVAM